MSIRNEMLYFYCCLLKYNFYTKHVIVHYMNENTKLNPWIKIVVCHPL